MKRLFAGLARRRLQSMPAEPPSPEQQEANGAFLEALVSRNCRDAQAAYRVIARYARPEPPISAAERAKRDLRTKALLKWIDAVIPRSPCITASKRTRLAPDGDRMGTNPVPD